MPKKGRKSGAAGKPTSGDPHPRGGRGGPPLDDDEEELGIARLYEEDEEEDPFSVYPEPAADVVRRLSAQPVTVNLAGLMREADERPSLLDEVDIDDVLGGLYDEEEMDVEDGDGDGGEDEDEEDDEEEGDATEVGAASTSPDAAESEEVSTSTSYVVFRPAATISLRDAAVQTSRGVSSLEKTIINKGKKNKRRRLAKKRKAQPEHQAAEAPAPAVAATPAVTEPAPSSSTPPAKRQRPAKDIRQKLNAKHSGDPSYALDRAIVKRAAERGIAISREHRAEIVAKFVERPTLDARRESGAIPKRRPPKEEVTAPEPSVKPPKKRKKKPSAPPAPTPAPSATTEATGGGAGSSFSIAEQKRAELETIQHLQRQMLAAHQRMARLDFESSAAAVSAASALSMTPFPASRPASLPGAKGRKK